MPINECCNTDVVCCEADTAIPDVAALMRTHHVGDVIVVENQNDIRIPIGIITDRDIVIETVARDVDVTAFTAGDLMSAPVATVRKDEGIVETARMMRSHKVRRIPVVTESGSLYGIVTVDDLLSLLATEMLMIADAAAEQTVKEARTRR